MPLLLLEGQAAMTLVFYKYGRRKVRLQVHHERAIRPIPFTFPSVIRARQFSKEKLSFAHTTPS